MSKKTVNYRKAEIINQDGSPSSKSLQELFEEALKSPHISTPFKSAYAADADSAYLLLFTHGNGTPFRREGCTCGCISFYDTEKKVPLIDSEVVNDEIFTEDVMPIDSNGKRRNLEQDTIYFAIRDNHVAMVISNMRGINMFIDFLYILLQDEAKIVENASIGLINIPTNEAINKIRNADVKSFSFSSSAYQTETLQLTPQEVLAYRQEGKNKRVKKVFKRTDLLEALLKVFKADSILEQLSEKDDLGSLSIAVEFIYRSTKNEKGQAVLNNFANHFGGIENLNTVINLGKNGTIKQNELTVKGEVEILDNNKILNKHNAYTVIAKWLIEQIKNGRV